MNIITEHWEIISSTAAVVLAYFGGKKAKDIELKRGNEDYKSEALNNISSNFKAYQDLINDLEPRFKSRISDQENYIKKLKVRLLKYENVENG